MEINDGKWDKLELQNLVNKRILIQNGWQFVTRTKMSVCSELLIRIFA